ncbi:MAG: ribosomal-processing cysteine protease Prp [Lachnospiraceae bacterium]|nr:ribosomal-processing cysteine protease Prp [Lachnospiraceae bacterium]
MTTVTIYNDNTGKYIGFDVCGHAEYDNPGYDIVCAAISMLVTNTINSIEKFSGLSVGYESDEEEGVIKFHINDAPNHDSQLLIDAMILGLSELEKNYKQNVTLKTEEV